MKSKLTLLMTVLLLAVGWSSTAFAQAYVLKADDMKDWTYKYVPQGSNDSVEVNYVFPNPKTGKYAAPEVTDPYQIYGLLRAVYMDKRLPGPYYNAYTSTGVREDPTYYGGIEGGWNIPYGAVGGGTSTTTTYDDIVIYLASDYTDELENACVSSIQIIADGTTISTLTTSNIGSSPDGWSISGNWYTWNGYFYTTSSTNSLTFDGDRLAGYSSVQVKVTGYHYNYSNDYGYTYVYVNGKGARFGSSSATGTWDIEGVNNTVTAGATTPTDVLIRTNNTGYNTNYTLINNITVKDGNTTLYSWSASSNGATLPSGGYASQTLSRYTSSYYYMSGGGTIRIPAEKFAGHNQITVSVTGDGYFYICDRPLNTSTGKINWTTVTSTYTCTINFPAVVNTNTYRPDHEGYTALVVAVKNNAKIHPEDLYFYHGACEYTTKDSVIDYISRNIKSVKLLTDGLRIGAGDSIGTVFNCDGTYNKFFFLGKGRARKKSSGVLTSIGNTSAGWPSYACEEVPFKYMYEQFSPTTGDEGDEITDFYIEMMDGAVYDIVHDCASVIQNGHQFSMSGNAGTQQYAMSGMNFFIPDYRLKFWSTIDTVATYTDGSAWTETVDGRDMNPYMRANANGKTGVAFNTAGFFAVDYANYNPKFPPRVGLYLLTLDAEAFPCQGYDPDNNANYTVTLDWTSSLNEMSGGDVPQKYVIYEVMTDSLGNEYLDSIDIVTNVTHYDFGGKLWPQTDYSQTHTYIIKGWPTDSDHPSFIAWSNEDPIVIPGLKDFLALAIDHYESDFDVPGMQNWYRNFLNVNNENDANGLTTDKIYQGYNVFNLMRYEDRDSTHAVQVAQIVFENLSDGTVKYTVSYVDENGNPTQDIEAAKYQLGAMNIPTTGILTVVADGDIIIQPNGYDVNFLSIQVQAGNYNRTWTASSNTLPPGWSVSTGSSWIKEDGAYYLEGNGYILIPASTIGNYTTATVTINAYGDAGKTAKIKVNGDGKTILNGKENAKDYIWTVTKGSKAPQGSAKAPRKVSNKPEAPKAGTTEAKDNAPESKVSLRKATNNN